MAKYGDGALCPKCGAKGKDGIGTERTRITSSRVMSFSDDPKIVARRKRARAIHSQNHSKD